MPVDRETGRPRGFAFVEFADRALAEQVIQKFDAQPFQGRNLAVSEARAREDRPPPRPGGGGYGGPRPSGSGYAGGGGGGGYGARPSGGFSSGSGGRDRSANFGPPAPPRRLRGPKKGQDHKVRGPIKEKATGRIYAVDDAEDDTVLDIDKVATRAPADPDLDADTDTVTDDAVESDATSSRDATSGDNGDSDDQS